MPGTLCRGSSGNGGKTENQRRRTCAVSRRGEGVFPVLIVRTIRPDTIFIPYHWGEQLAVNQLTNPALDPTSKIPEFKAVLRESKRFIHGSCRFSAGNVKAHQPAKCG